MNRQRVRLALLAVVLCAVAYSAYQPHWRVDTAPYTLPVHLDEYWHWGMAEDVLRTGQADGRGPFFGPTTADDAGGFRYPREIHERGFHAFLAATSAVTGIELVHLIEFLPLVVAVFTALVIFELAERWGAGVEAALWFAAVPTSLRFLGPGFAVPVTFALALVLVGVLLAVRADAARAWSAVMIVLSSLWPIHAMGALLLGGLVGLTVLSRQRARWVSAAAVAVGIPTLFAWPSYVSDLSQPILRETWLPPGLDSIRIIGASFFILAAVGASWLVLKREVVGFALGAAAALGMSLVVLRNTVEWDPVRLHDRAVTTMFPLLAILAGTGMVAVPKLLRAIGRRSPPLAALTGPAVILVVLSATLAAAGGVTRDAEQPYYRILTSAQYAQFVEIGSTPLDRSKFAVFDGRATMAWSAVTGVATTYAQTPTRGNIPDDIEEFFVGGASDTVYLIDKNAVFVITGRAVTNPDLVRITENVYMLRPEISSRLG